MRSHHILYDITCIVSSHHSLYIWHYIHSMCVTKTSASIIPHQLSVGHHTHSMYDITVSMHDITWTLYDIKPIYVWHHKQYIYDIITIYMISTLLLSWKHNYTWHHTHYMWHHSHCICAASPAVSIDHKNSGSYPTWHTYDIIHSPHNITITLYDFIPQYLWHHGHCFMTSDPLHRTSSPGFMTSRPLSL